MENALARINAALLELSREAGREARWVEQKAEQVQWLDADEALRLRRVAHMLQDRCHRIAAATI